PDSLSTLNYLLSTAQLLVNVKCLDLSPTALSLLVMLQLLENFFRAATNLSAVLFRICPRRRRQPMRIKKSQCLFGVLSRQLLLRVCQIRFGEGLVRVSRFRISK